MPIFSLPPSSTPFKLNRFHTVFSVVLFLVFGSLQAQHRHVGVFASHGMNHYHPWSADGTYYYEAEAPYSEQIGVEIGLEGVVLFARLQAGVAQSSVEIRESSYRSQYFNQASTVRSSSVRESFEYSALSINGMGQLGINLLSNNSRIGFGPTISLGYRQEFHRYDREAKCVSTSGYSSHYPNSPYPPISEYSHIFCEPAWPPLSKMLVIRFGAEASVKISQRHQLVLFSSYEGIRPQNNHPSGFAYLNFGLGFNWLKAGG